MSAEKTPTTKANQLPERIKFDYIKSNFFRVVYADGAVGGLTPKLGIRMAFYNERNAIPRQTTHTINAEGALSPEIREERIARDAIVREVEVDVVMDLKAAVSLVQWLQDKIADAKGILETTGPREKKS